MHHLETTYLLLAFGLIICQLGLLLPFLHFSGIRSNQVIYRYSNPACWVTLFYCTWYLLPQFYALLPGHAIIGLDSHSAFARLEMVIWSQLHLLVFLCSVVLGCVAMTPLLATRESPWVTLAEPLSKNGRWYVTTCFLVGVVATAILGIRFMTMDGMRAQLVKSLEGKLLTILCYFGAFGFAFIISRAYIVRRYLVVVVATLIFGSAVFFTGSRGRFMWPMLLAVVYVSAHRNHLDVRKFVLTGVILVAILVFSDRILIALRTDNLFELTKLTDVKQNVDTIFLKRNFDGFANFTLVLNDSNVVHDRSVLLNGARDFFMNRYFPKTYATGVGTGVGYPTMFWIAVGFWGLPVFGIAFGCTLGLINAGLRLISDERIYWAYLIAMPWYCAIGGNFQESIDKMFAAMIAPILWLVLSHIWRSDLSFRIRLTT